MFGFGNKGSLIILVCLVAVGVYIIDQRQVPSMADMKAFPENMVLSLSGQTSATLTKEAVIDGTNAERRARGLDPLSENSLLNDIAYTRARDMLEKQYFAHVSPTGSQASDVAREVGYRYKIIAENLAAGNFLSARKMVEGWMQSPGHRKNILTADVTEIGVAIVKGKMHGRKTVIGVQIFGLPSPPVSLKTCPKPSEDLAREIEMKKAQIRGLQDRLDRIREELEGEKQSIESDRQAVGSRAQDRYDLDVRIRTYNEKGRWYNGMAADINAKASVLQSMVDEYNRSIRDYEDCRDSE
jgi:uncharacterized protein YkwD